MRQPMALHETIARGRKESFNIVMVCGLRSIDALQVKHSSELFGGESGLPSLCEYFKVKTVDIDCYLRLKHSHMISGGRHLFFVFVYIYELSAQLSTIPPRCIQSFKAKNYSRQYHCTV